MLKINLNELKKYKIFTNFSDYYEEDYESGEYYPAPSYFCGFIEDICIKDKNIIFKVYGYGLQGKIQYDEFIIDIKYIEKYESGFESMFNKNNDSEYKEFYEYVSIDTYKSYKFEMEDYKSRITDSCNYRLYKNLDFKFLMKRFYDVIPSTFICDCESKMLMDEKILKIVNIPDDYEFGEY